MMKRLDRDFYPTPDKLIRAYLNHQSRPLIEKDSRILEPCKGDGAILSPLIEMGFSKARGTDIADGDEFDATKGTYWKAQPQPDWVVSNPPFNVATEIVDYALRNVKCGVIMLLRSSFLEPCKKRRHLLNTQITHITFCNPRPKFRTDTKGTDSSTVAFICWSLKNPKDSQNAQVSYLIDWH
jgi:16S rRNA A1518/A1519 N6-dimethyltransferase RsmA/KsgA/DIM1 with predicted DNA glycosylase/AP lyase activity